MTEICDGLRWVRDNIARFGGDPGNVTAIGESGGGWKNCCLTAMSSAKSLFHKVAVESRLFLDGVPRDRAAATTLATLKVLGIEKSDWRRLMQVPAD
jgi:para-nitrobenzyl esterase